MYTSRVLVSTDISMYRCIRNILLEANVESLWTAKRTNITVLNEVNVDIQLRDIVKKPYSHFFDWDDLE